MASDSSPAHSTASRVTSQEPDRDAADSREQDEAIIAAIVRFGLEVAELALGSGSYSSTVRLLTLRNGQRAVLKIPYVRRKLHREITALEALKSDLPIPAVLDTWIPDDDGPGAMLLSYLPGVPADEEVSPALAHGMGSLIAAMHQHGLPRYGEVYRFQAAAGVRNPPEQDWWALMVSRFELWRAQCESVMPADLFARSIAVYEKLAEALPDPDGPVWTHHDYRPGNVLVQRATITGLIDFESARGGAADVDFVKMSHELWERTPATKQSFLDGYASIRPLPPIEETLPFYQLHNALGGIAWCVRRTNINDPFFQENLDVIQALTARYGG
ncbi:MAG: aminoglycoside phosphotransferase family protein [Anaerolineae bacterium]|nr:aminoglycoside phosphotransferase family protein [Anaerolineae bacterium]